MTWFGAGLVTLAGLGCGADTMDNAYDPTAGNMSPTTITPTTNTPTTNTPTTNTPNTNTPTTTQNPPTTTETPTTPTMTVEAGDIPCDANEVVKKNCHGCHGATPLGGAVRLVTVDDWHKMSMSPKYDMTKQVYEIAQIRINDGSMPQGGQLLGDELSTLDSWLLAGAKGAATQAEMTCTSTPAPTTGPTTTTPTDYDRCKDNPEARQPLVPTEENEQCWEFPVHGPGSMESKFTVSPGESYHEWYYDVPWPADHVMSKFGGKFDNEPVLHHYLTFARPNSTRKHGDLDQNVLGTTLGDAAELISGWAVGGCNTYYPEDVGVKLTTTGKIMVQWHMYNNTGAPAQDHSIVQVCTVPGAQREHTAGLTFLGTELIGAGILGMPPGPGQATGTCVNNSGKDIFIIGWTPHMHEIGVRMVTDIKRAGSADFVNLFDQPFQFDYQTNYMEPEPVKVAPGDALRTTCHFNNTTAGNVAFGQSTKAEMCYQFTLAYPYGALNNGVVSLIGATNTCW